MIIRAVGRAAAAFATRRVLATAAGAACRLLSRAAARRGLAALAAASAWVWLLIA